MSALSIRLHGGCSCTVRALLFHGGVPTAFPAPTKSIRSAISTFHVQSGVVRITNGVQCGTWLVERCFSDKPRVVMRLVAWSGAVSFRAQTCWTGESVNVIAKSHVSMLRSFREVLISSMRGFLSPAALESTFFTTKGGVYPLRHLFHRCPARPLHLGTMTAAQSSACWSLVTDQSCTQ